MKFIEHLSGLYVFKPETMPNNSTSVSAYLQCTLVNIVEENKKMFTKRQVDLADKARELNPNPISMPMDLLLFKIYVIGMRVFACSLLARLTSRYDRIFGDILSFG